MKYLFSIIALSVACIETKVESSDMVQKKGPASLKDRTSNRSLVDEEAADRWWGPGTFDMAFTPSAYANGGYYYNGVFNPVNYNLASRFGYSCGAWGCARAGYPAAVVPYTGYPYFKR